MAAATTTTATVLGAGHAAAAGIDLQPISFIDTRVGGVLDGTTDNGPSGTNALAKAVGILGAQGGEIFIPPGVAKFASRPWRVAVKRNPPWRYGAATRAPSRTAGSALPRPAMSGPARLGQQRRADHRDRVRPAQQHTGREQHLRPSTAPTPTTTWCEPASPTNATFPRRAPTDPARPRTHPQGSPTVPSAGRSRPPRRPALAVGRVRRQGEDVLEVGDGPPACLSPDPPRRLV